MTAMVSLVSLDGTEAIETKPAAKALTMDGKGDRSSEQKGECPPLLKMERRELGLGQGGTLGMGGLTTASS